MAYFKPGQSGNPSGKPKGAKDKRTEIRRMLESRGQEVVDTVLDMAINDRDPTALKLVMERISPKPKSDRANLGLDITKVGGSEELRNIISQVLLKAIQGDVPDDQGKSITSLIESITKLDVMTEDRKRIEALEEKLGVKN
jgi:hypothetical protein